MTTLEIADQMPAVHHHLLLRQQQRQQLGCDLHPEEPVTGFCASCLRERLHLLEQPASAPAPRRKSTSSAAGVRSFFGRPAAGGDQPPDLRRCRSFSAARGFSGAAPHFESGRRSCDVRARSTLWSLFHNDDTQISASSVHLPPPSAAAVAYPVVVEEDDDDDGDEIRPVDPDLAVEESSREIQRDYHEDAAAEATEFADYQQAKKNPPAKDLKEIAGSFWIAASVFSKKLQRWRRKHKHKKESCSAAAAAMPSSSSLRPVGSSRWSRDAQSEIAAGVDAMLGRRSCDTDPRFSLDIGRISLDCSWDEPRASWDGYLAGTRPGLPRIPPAAAGVMLAAVEAAPPPLSVQREDGRIPVEEDFLAPGGSIQTRDYYLDSSSQRRRRSLDRSSSSSTFKLSGDPKIASNPKVSPTNSSELFFRLNHHHHQQPPPPEREGKEYFSWKEAHRHPQEKKAKKWSIWGLIHWRSGSRGGSNAVERTLSESWPELRRQCPNGGGRISRSNSSLSSQHSFRAGDVNELGRKAAAAGTPAVERNRSGRYLPGSFDNNNNGMFRPYPATRGGGGGRRVGGWPAMNRQGSSQYFMY